MVNNLRLLLIDRPRTQSPLESSFNQQAAEGRTLCGVQVSALGSPLNFLGDQLSCPVSALHCQAVSSCPHTWPVHEPSVAAWRGHVEKNQTLGQQPLPILQLTAGPSLQVKSQEQSRLGRRAHGQLRWPSCCAELALPSLAGTAAR